MHLGPAAIGSIDPSHILIATCLMRFKCFGDGVMLMSKSEKLSDLVFSFLTELGLPITDLHRFGHIAPW